MEKIKEMNFKKTELTDSIIELRTSLYQSLKAPIDAMWELLYIASAQHYLIADNNTNWGYCCINEEDCLVQIYLREEFNAEMNKVIKKMINTRMIKSASLSTNEPIAFNACLLHSKSIVANTFCYEHSNKEIEAKSNLNIELVRTQDIPNIKLFLKEQLGMDDTFGYTENLVSRKEIYMLRESDTIIATSECRISDSQPNTADIGFIVHKDYRGQGIATQIMKQQINRVLSLGRNPICSTTKDNIASQKVIEKSGFYCSNIIFDMDFCG